MISESPGQRHFRSLCLQYLSGDSLVHVRALSPRLVDRHASESDSDQQSVSVKLSPTLLWSAAPPLRCLPRSAFRMLS